MPWFVYRDVPEGRIQRGLTRVLAAIALLSLLAFPLPAEEEKLSDDALYRNTLSIDIDTAGYYELLSWCEKLGLDTKGTRQDLAARLRGFYKLANTVESKTLPGESDEKSITVTSADSVRSFTIDFVDEKYVSFRGDVLLTLKDEKTSHSIEADSVVLNQTEKTITAFGNIRYTMEKEGRKEYFTGESLTFSVDDLSGFFYKGFSEKKQKIGEKELTFYYSGNTMYRSSGNIVTMKDGIITSCERSEPHYSIHATKIWVLGPGEWAIKGGALYLGYVPVAYLPFFFKPGDAFFFNPSLGYRTREGYFLQTTTYLLGKRNSQPRGYPFSR
jgi:lipopolysaccharide assembly outer membrane protein LptD (OstA)